ncbi:MAG: helix-turn-helix domain-containing protein [Thermoproteota archaeon]
MSLENITSRFVDLGLDGEEAAVLRDLYLSGESKAGDLAKSCGLARIRVYRILERLREMGIVESTMGRPVIFSAIPPERAIEKLIGHAAKKLEQMESAREQVMQELAKFKLHQKPQVEAKYRIVQGKSQIYSMVSQMIGAAGSEILAYIGREDLLRIAYTDIPDELVRAKKRGTRIMILTDVDYSLDSAMREYSEYADLRHTRIPGMSILLVADESELVVSAMTRADSASGDVALWMNGRNFVAGIRGLLSDSWENAIDARTRVDIMKGGGRAFEDVLIIKGSQPISEFYRGMLARAKKQVLHFSVPYDCAFFDATARDALAAGANDSSGSGSSGSSGSSKKIKTRILTSIEKESLGKLKRLGDSSCEVRHADAKAGVNITLVDDDEVMLTPAAGSRGQSAIWSSVRDYVEHYRIMFDSLWSSSTAMADRAAAIEAQEKVSRLMASVRQLLEGAGLEILQDVKGASGLAHRFSISASAGKGDDDGDLTHASIVVDIVGPDKPDPQAALIGFLVKCMDVRADCKVLITLAGDPSAVKAPARSLHRDVVVMGADGAEDAIRRLVGNLQRPPSSPLSPSPPPPASGGKTTTA